LQGHDNAQAIWGFKLGRFAFYSGLQCSWAPVHPCCTSQNHWQIATQGSVLRNQSERVNMAENGKICCILEQGSTHQKCPCRLRTAEDRDSKTFGSSSVATTDKRFHRTMPKLIGGGDLGSRHAACVCANSRAGTPINTEQERSGEELLWLFASTNKP
jgi:hypothetical protein